MRIGFKPYRRRDGSWTLYLNNDRGVSVEISPEKGFGLFTKLTGGQRKLIDAASGVFASSAAPFTGDLAAHGETVAECGPYTLAITDVASVGGMPVGEDGCYIIRDGAILRAGIVYRSGGSVTHDEFAAAAMALLGRAAGWQSAIARRLGVNDRTVRRWIGSDTVPDWVGERLAELMGAREPAPWPRDEWLVGDGFSVAGRGALREYIAHLQPPRFVARIVQTDDDGEPDTLELPADVTSGTVYRADLGLTLCEIAWIDHPEASEIARWLEAASDALEDDRINRAIAG